MAKSKYSEAARAERRRQDRERLQRAAEQLLCSEAWQRWVLARSKKPKGDKGDSATSFVVRESAPAAVAVGASVAATAQCLPGERATGGGDDVSGLGENATVVVDSQPTATGTTPDGWTVKVLNVSGFLGGGPSDVVAKVVCASP